jgi:hypothetical protein
MIYDVIIIGRELVENFLFLPRGPDQWAVLKGALLSWGEPPAVLKDLLYQREVVAIPHEEFWVESWDPTHANLSQGFAAWIVDALL